MSKDANVAGQEAVAKALAELVRQVHLSNAVDDNGHALSKLKALFDAEALLASPPPSAVAQIVAWLDMASAPKDGTIIIGQGSEGEVFRCQWQSSEYIWRSEGRGVIEDYDPEWWSIDGDQSCFPQRWMPLPEAGEWQGTPVPKETK